ncbi:purine nucleoside phosphorylase I, inosine and guanosine-specific [Thermotoga sp. KOL6]|uniref:purine nucleoside phosphorylase I, inosine and guanosine-specific n=1 Tax=Thermotoga sp. KOL6 TaxID=126741 RepID=UPI000C7876F5|nr:purine nucleoside phosphorylase [Thermotoga sp. KOL6]
MMKKIEEASSYIREKIEIPPDILIILGSGFSSFVDSMSDPITIDYKEIPHFPQPTVEGHRGKLVFGKIKDRSVMVMAGRYHLYEGHEPQTVVFPVYVSKQLGARGAIITNAAGAINPTYKPGEVILVRDVINFMFRNPLRGPNDERIGPRFPDMSSIADPEWVKKLKGKIDFKEGVYIGVLGPSYETPAEIKAFKKFGADLVGMSTVPEVIAAKHCGLKLIVFSCVTNMAAGITHGRLSHEEVVRTTKMVQGKIEKILKTAVEVF